MSGGRKTLRVTDPRFNVHSLSIEFFTLDGQTIRSETFMMLLHGSSNADMYICTMYIHTYVCVCIPRKPTQYSTMMHQYWTAPRGDYHMAGKQSTELSPQVQRSEHTKLVRQCESECVPLSMAHVPWGWVLLVGPQQFAVCACVCLAC